jgi:hypothetical protein
MKIMHNWFMNFFSKLLLLALLISPLPLHADADTGRPNPELGPTRVEVNIFLLDLDSIDSASQNFSANVYFEGSWKDPRLADKAHGKTITRRLDEVWHPRLQILNQQRIWKSLPDLVDIEPDGTVTQRSRVWGYFAQPMDLREFPFDRQAIKFHIVAAGYSPEQLVITPGPMSGMAENFSVADWKVVDWRLAADIKVPGPEGVQDSSIAMVLNTDRLSGYYWIKVIAPLILIVAMSWAVFWIDPKELSTKVSITITAMLTLIAYRFAIGTHLPEIPYLTRIDLFILISTILIYASLVSVLITSTFSRKGNHELATRIDQVARWGFPLFFISSWVFSMMLPT